MVIQRSAGLEADTPNMQWINRAKKYYHMAPADIYAFLIPIHYRLSTGQVKKWVRRKASRNLWMSWRIPVGGRFLEEADN